MEAPKYSLLIDWVRGQLAGGALGPGDRLPSEKELGGRFSVSRQTVRRALAALVAEGVLEPRQGSGTYVAARRPPAAGRVVGVVTTYTDTYIFPSIIKGIEAVLTAGGCLMQLALSHNRPADERAALCAMLDSGVAGLILEPAQSGLESPNRGLYERLAREGPPAVFINGYYPALPIPHVALEDKMAGFAAADCLLRAGHRRLLGIFKADDYQGRLRHEGFLAALQAAGLKGGADVLWYTTQTLPGLFCPQGELWGRVPGPTGVVCYNDEIAFSLLGLLRERGLQVPGQVSVVGIDNSDLARLAEVPLSTVEHPMDRLGRAAAQKLLGLLRGEAGAGASLDFPPRLVERASVGPPPSEGALK